MWQDQLTQTKATQPTEGWFGCDNEGPRIKGRRLGCRTGPLLREEQPRSCEPLPAPIATHSPVAVATAGSSLGDSVPFRDGLAETGVSSASSVSSSFDPRRVFRFGAIGRAY